VALANLRLWHNIFLKTFYPICFSTPASDGISLFSHLAFPLFLLFLFINFLIYQWLFIMFGRELWTSSTFFFLREIGRWMYIFLWVSSTLVGSAGRGVFFLLFLYYFTLHFLMAISLLTSYFSLTAPCSYRFSFFFFLFSFLLPSTIHIPLFSYTEALRRAGRDLYSLVATYMTCNGRSRYENRKRE